MSSEPIFRTRAAPSPTGYLHLGFARQLIFNKLFAKINNGIYYFRLEDTDRNRLIPESAAALVKNLGILGLSPDEGVNLDQKGIKDYFYGVYQSGELGPYIQSERLPIYHEHAQKLLDRQLAYWSYLSEDEKQELQEIKKATKHPINYFKINQEKFGDKIFKSVAEGLADPAKPALTYRLQRSETIKCSDLLVGQTDFDLSLEEDFVILKSGGFPTYHLAHLIDDYLMKTTLVLRAQEWYPSIAKHATMYQDYWGELPFEYLHVPFILGESGNRKMSKRDGNVNMQFYLDQGYLPEAIINYLAFLGWNPGTEKELYLNEADFVNIREPEDRVKKLIDNLAADFSIDKLSKSPARFSLEKLNWFNRQYISMMSLEEFSYRSFELKTQISHDDKKLRLGDYVYLVDTKEQKIFGLLGDVNVDSPIFHPLGGGREPELNAIQNLQKEVGEETEGKYQVDPAKLLPVAKVIKIHNYFRADEDTHYNGKEFNIFFHPTAIHEIAEYSFPDTNGEIHPHGWIDLAKVISSNTLLTYPLWKKFCETNNIPLFEATSIIKTQYLAWNLDKNRITTLSELGTESSCVLNYRKPDLEDVKWRKISLEESLNNLKEISTFIYEIANRYQLQKSELADSVFSLEVNTKFQQLTKLIEDEVKGWLIQNQKDAGSYLWPLRVVLSGKIKSPSPFELIAVLPQAEIEKRINAFLEV